MRSTKKALCIFAMMIFASIIFLSSALMFTILLEPAQAGKTSTTIVSSAEFQQNVAVVQEQDLGQEGQVTAVKITIPEKYEEYLDKIDTANNYLEQNPEYTDLIKDFDEKGINVVADDVSFYIEIDEDGLIEKVTAGINQEYNTVEIQDDFDDFMERAQVAEDIGDFWNLASDVDIPLKYYLKAPKLASLIF